MFVLLFVFTHQTSISLNKLNYESIINQSFQIPVFVEVWNKWCSHCAAFSKTWNHITNNTLYDNKIIFADIECNSQSRVCKRFNGEHFPRLYLIFNGEIRSYSGSLDVQHICEYIDFLISHQNNILIPITSENDVNYDNNAFVFNTFSESDLQTANNIACKHIDLAENKFYVIYESKNNHHKANTLNLTYIIDEFHSINFTSNNTTEFDLFIDHHSIKILEFYSEPVHYIIEKLKLNTLIFFDYKKSIKKLAYYIVEKYPFMTPLYANCSKWKYPCRYYGAKKNSLIFSDKNKNIFFKIEYDENFTKVIEWLNTIFTGKEEAKGPGTNIFLSSIYELRGNGDMRYYLLYFPLILLIVVVVLIVMFEIYDKIEQKKVNKKD